MANSRVDGGRGIQSRQPVMGLGGAISTTQPLAATVGLDILRAGGNAVDAAAAVIVALGVLEPAQSGVGGDLFALVWDPRESRVVALNGSGPTGGAASADRLRTAGFTQMPGVGPHAGASVTVPGAMRALDALVDRYGRRSLDTLMIPAIDYATRGFPLSPTTAAQWAEQAWRLRPSTGRSEFHSAASGPAAGDVAVFPRLAGTLRRIAEKGVDVLYTGGLAAQISMTACEAGGFLTPEDIAAYAPQWETPISATYGPLEIFECPPNGQGLAALVALRALGHLDHAGWQPASAERLHATASAMRLALEAGFASIGDPRLVPVDTDRLLSDAYTSDLAQQVLNGPPGTAGNLRMPPSGDTSYVSVIDADGMACSLIASLSDGFGSGLEVADTGIVLQNRGHMFSLRDEHPNCLAPNRRPYHTIIPAMATRDGSLWCSFGAVGGYRQPQAHVQLVQNLADDGMDPQAAIDAPRFSIDVESGECVLEPGLAHLADDLTRRGHRVRLARPVPGSEVAGASVVIRNADGVLTAGAESRTDGTAAVL